MARRLCSLGILALFLLAGAGLVSAAWEPAAALDPAAPTPIPSTTRIDFVPQHQEIGLGDVVTVALNIVDAEDLYAVDIEVHFDPQVLQVVDAQSAADGVQILPGDFPAPPLPISPNTVNNQTGVIEYATMILGGQQGVYGAGTLATITFEGVGAGTGELSFERVWMYSPSMGQLAPIIGGDGDIVVWLEPPDNAIFLPLATRNRR
ncbi:MAG: hypothetical protein GXY76_01150 [Chloroflexi bacterium]|nr:hypothetical protein [Chloroflexota bacterium]